MRGNTILMHLNRGQTSRAGELFQYDYGQKLLFAGVTLPESYEVHFSNQEHGSSKTMLGDATGVDIPDEYLTSGDPVHVWVYLHDGADDGETEYHGIIGVAKRAKPTDQQPTPVQQSIIEQAITALNAGVTEVEGIAFAIPINNVLPVIGELIDKGYVSGKASLGLSFDNRYNTVYSRYYRLPEGAFVSSVQSGSCSEAAGIQPGDILMRIGDYPIEDYADVPAALRHFSSGETTEVTVYRNSQIITVTVCLDEAVPSVPQNTSRITYYSFYRNY